MPSIYSQQFTTLKDADILLGKINIHREVDFGDDGVGAVRVADGYNFTRER